MKGMTVKIGDKVTITQGYEAGRTGIVLRINPSGAVLVNVANIGNVLLSPGNLEKA